MNNISKGKETFLFMMIFLSACCFFMPVKAVPAEDSLPVFVDEDFENCFGSSMPFDYSMTDTDEDRTYGEFYFEDDSGLFEKATATIWIWFYADPTEAEADYLGQKKSFNHTLDWIAEEEILRLLYSDMGDAENSIVYAGPTSVVGKYLILYKEHYIVTFEVASSGQESWWSDETAMDYFNAGRECIKTFLSDSQYLLEMKTYHPFSDDIPKGYSGGDFVARVLDRKNSNYPVANKLVYFFRGSQDQDYFRLPYSSDAFGSDHKASKLSNDYVFDKTNAGGNGRFNYISNGCIDYDLLGKTLEKEGTVKIPITAVVFDQDPLTTAGEAKITGSASYEIVLKGIARIKKVGTLDERVKPQGQVIVQRNGTETAINTSMLLNEDYETGYRGYNLYYGDKVFLDKYDEAFVQWLAGASMILRPNPDHAFSAENKMPFAEIGCSDAGWGSRLDGIVNSVSLQGIMSLVGLRVAVYGATATAAASWVSPAGIFLAIPGVVAYVWNGVKGYCSPILLEHKSQILMDYDNDAVSVYTAEGTATLHNIDSWDTVDVTAGHKTAVSSEGAFESVSEFSESDLNEGQSDMLQTVRQEEGDETCAITTLLGSNDPGLDTIRQFRDSFLATSSTGKRLISLFYENNDAMVAYINESPLARRCLKKLVNTLLPALACFL